MSAGTKELPKTAFIYTLADPESPNEVRYVGKTSDITGRLRNHRNECNGAHSATWKNNWIKSLRAKGLSPTLDILEEIPETDYERWQEAERFWISYLRFIGCRLTNISIGGHGGDSLSDETIAKLKAIRNTPDAKERVSKWRKALPITEETRAKLSQAHTGKVFSDERRQNISRSKLGKKFSDSHREALSKARAGVKRGPYSESRKKALSLGQIHRYQNATPEQKERWRLANIAGASTQEAKLHRSASQKLRYSTGESRRATASAVQRWHASMTDEKRRERSEKIGSVMRSPETNSKLRAALADPEYKARLSARMKEKWRKFREAKQQQQTAA